MATNPAKSLLSCALPRCVVCSREFSQPVMDAHGELPWPFLSPRAGGRWKPRTVTVGHQPVTLISFFRQR